MTATHPNDRELSDFLLGKLLDSHFAEVEAHLAECQECGNRALSVPTNDTLVELLTAARTRLDMERSIASTPTLDGVQTPPAFAPTLAYSGATATGLADEAPAALANHPKYRIVRRLGTGGMGTVWLAEHTVMNRPVAIKVIRPDLLARPGAKGRFLREVRAAAKLHHANIVTAFDAEQVGDSCLLVMEYVPGETLGERVQSGPLPILEACRAVRDAARGLAVAHKAGLVHRDVKPHNLIRDSEGTTKVLDFGLAGVGAGEIVAANGEGLTGAGMVVGTPAYIAPEQIVDPRSADARADIYGLGCTLYHLLAGRPPVPEGSITDTLAAQQTYVPEPIAQLPPGLTSVLAKMIAKRPEDRYQTANEVAIAMESFSGARSVSEGESVTLANASGSGGRGIRRWLALAAGILLVVTAGVVFKIQRDNQEITITTNDADLEVIAKRKGEIVRITDKKSGQVWEYDMLKHQIGLADRPDGFWLELEQGGLIVMKRTGDKDAQPVFSIARHPKTEVAAKTPAATAPEAVERFLKLLDEKNFAQCWEEAASPLRESLSKKEFVPEHERMLKPFGDVKKRSVIRRQLAGDSFTIEYLAQYSEGDRVESIIALREKDKLWRVGSYHLRLPEKSDFPPARADVGLIHDLRWPGPDKMLYYTIFSPNGRYFLVGGDHSSAVWETTTGKLITTFNTTAGAAFMPDNRHVLADRGNERLMLWDVMGDKEVREFERHIAARGYLSVSADGKRALSSRHDMAVLWDVETGKPLAEYKPKHKGSFVAKLAPDGKTIATVGTEDRTALLWDTEQKKQIKSWVVDGNAAYGVITFLPDGRSFVTQADYGGGLIVRFDINADKSAPVRDVQYVEAAGVSPNGRFALLHDGKTAVRGHDLITGRDLGRIVLPTDVRGSIGISPDGRYGAAPGRTAGARVYVFRLPEPQPSTKSDHEGFQGNWLAVSREHAGKPWDAAATKMTRLVFDGEVFHFTFPFPKDLFNPRSGDGPETTSGTFTLDPTKKPGVITLIGEEGDGILVQGIYQLEGERLTLCLGKPGRDRPRQFKTQAGGEEILIVLRRATDGVPMKK